MKVIFKKHVIYQTNFIYLCVDYECIKVMVDVYTYNQTGPLYENIFIWKSEREYVLDTVEPMVRVILLFLIKIHGINQKGKFLK